MAITDMAIDECPVSIKARLPEMDVLASEILHYQSVQEGSGAVPFGLDTNEWPSKWFDVVNSARMEERRIENERGKMTERMRNGG